MARKSATAAPESAELESLARAALEEVTPAETVGGLLEIRPGAEAALTDVVFEPLQRGYSGWSWIVTIARVSDAVTGEPSAPTVVELALIPGDGALLAPQWVPWSVRLAEWEAQQKALAEAAGRSAEGEPDEESDEDDSDEDDDTEGDLDDADLDDEFDGDDDEPDEDPDADDEDDADDDDFDEDGPTRTHGGDIDGVDIDDLDVEED